MQTTDQKASSDRPKLKLKVKLKKNAYEFDVELNERNEGFMKALRSIDPHSSRSDSNTRTVDNTLTFSIKKFSAFIEVLQQLQPKYMLIVKPVWAPTVKCLQAFINENIKYWELKDSEDAVIKNLDLDDWLKEHLRPHHIDAVYFCKTRNGNCILADEIGVGKRLQALVVAKIFVGCWPLLIICPNIKAHIWLYDFQKLFPEYSHLKVLIVDSSTKSSEITTNFAVVIVGFELIERYQEVLRNNQYEMVILDEICMLSVESDRFKSLKSVIHDSEKRLVLTSTPMYKDTNELLRYFNLINPAVFDEKFVNSAINRYTSDTSDVLVNNKVEYKRLLHGSLMLRRTRDEVMNEKEMKKKLRRPVPLVLPHNSKKFEELQEVYEQIETEIDENEEKLQNIAVRWYELCSKIKLPFIEKYLDMLCAIKYHKIVCYVLTDKLGDEIVTHVKKSGDKYIHIKKTTSNEERVKLCAKFQSEDDIFAVVNLDIVNTEGVTLSSADTALFCELHWNIYLLIKAERLIADISSPQVSGIALIEYLSLINGNNSHLVDFVLWPLIARVFKLDLLVPFNSNSSVESKLTTVLKSALDCFVKYASDKAEETNTNGSHSKIKSSKLNDDDTKEVSRKESTKVDTKRKSDENNKKSDESEKSDNDAVSLQKRHRKKEKNLNKDEKKIRRVDNHNVRKNEGDKSDQEISEDELWKDEKFDPDYDSNQNVPHKVKPIRVSDEDSGEEEMSDESDESNSSDNVLGNFGSDYVIRRSRRITKHNRGTKKDKFAKLKQKRRKRIKVDDKNKEKRNSSSDESDSDSDSSSSSDSESDSDSKPMNKQAMKIMARSFVR